MLAASMCLGIRSRHSATPNPESNRNMSTSELFVLDEGYTTVALSDDRRQYDTLSARTARGGIKTTATIPEPLYNQPTTTTTTRQRRRRSREELC